MMRKNGFTLIELLVVISIIGVLSTIAMTSLNAARAKARDAKRISEIEQIKTALELYYSTYNYYPQYTQVGIACNTTATNSLNVLVVDGLLSSVPEDPTGTARPLCYEYLGLGTAADYSSASGWYCDGRPRTDYLYSFLFSTETTSSQFSRLTSSSGALLTSAYKYCIHGDLR